MILSLAVAPRARASQSTAGVARQTLAGLLIAGVAASLTIFVTKRTATSGATAVLVVAGSLWFATTRRPQLALALLMLYLGILDGYLKLASGSSYVTFVRDALLYALIVGLLVRATVQRKRLALPPMSGWVITFVVLVLIQLLNPQDGTLVHSLAGVRQDLEFVPLFFLTFAFVRTKKALRIFVMLLGVIAVANGIAGLVQFSETPAQFAAWGPGYSQRIFGTGNFAFAGRAFGIAPGQSSTRPFGLGSDAGSGGLFGALALGGVIALASQYTRRRYLASGVIIAAGATLAVVTSEGRGVIVGSVIMMLSFALLTATSRNRATSIVGAALAGLVAFFVVQAIVGSVGKSNPLRYQGLSPGSLVQTTNQARGASIAVIPHNLVTYPLGAGLATAGPASGAAPGGSSLTGTVNAETEFSFLTLEAGIPGMLVLTAFPVALLLLGLRRCRHEPDGEVRVLLAAVVAPLAGLLALYFASALTPTTPGGPYLWAAGGIVSYWLVALPADRRRRASSTADAPPTV